MREDFIAKRINELLVQRSWSIYKLSQECGLSNTTLYNIFERGTIPGIFTIEKIAEGFGITIAQFFSENEYPDLTPKQRQILKHYGELNEGKKIRLEAYLEGLLSDKE